MPRLPIAWLIACLTLARPLCAAQPPTDSLEPFRRGVALQEKGDLQGAVAAYEEFLAAHPANIEARSNLGVVLARLGRYEAAIDAYRTALAGDSSNVAVRLNLGIALYKSAAFAAAASEFATVVAAEPGHLQARYLQADCHLRLGEPKKVIALLGEFEATRPDDPPLAYMLGMAYLRDGQAERGQLLIDRILRNGDSAEARLMMGLAKRAVQDLTGAQEDLARAVELNPDLPTVHSAYGMALLEAGNRDPAREQFRAELQRNPADFDAHLFLGVILKEDAEFERALEHFRKALELRPGDLGARFQIAAVKVATGKTGDALPMLEAAVAEAPEFLEAHVLLATVYYRLQRHADGDRERVIIEDLNRKRQAAQPGAKPANAQPSGGA
jgi:tetratricopeptide (TPR) repeat protein